MCLKKKKKVSWRNRFKKFLKYFSVCYGGTLHILNEKVIIAEFKVIRRLALTEVNGESLN